MAIKKVSNLLADSIPSPYSQAGCDTVSNTAEDYLRNAANEIASRAVLRDQPTGERSMGKAVAAYRALFGEILDTETKGWQFMELLKMARMSGGKYHEDDYIDAIGYAALAAESAAKE